MRSWRSGGLTFAASKLVRVTRDERRETRDERRETRDEKQETRDEKQETRDERRETRDEIEVGDVRCVMRGTRKLRAEG